MAIFTGAGVAIVTPMKENGEVDFDKYGDLIDFQIENGIDAIVSCGTTGESSTLSHEEHLAVIRYAVERTAGRVPVVAGTGSNSTDEAIHLSKGAVEAGADALLLITPYYNKATQEGLYQHFRKTAEEVAETPIILYNVPSRTGCNLAPETTMRLVDDVKNIVAIKAATGNLAQESKLMSMARGSIDMYSGEDGLIVPLMSIGAIGVISVIANVAPQKTHDICEEFLAGNVKKARELQFDALPLVDALFSEVNPIPVKHALEMMGKCDATMRLPLTPMSADGQVKLREAMKGYGLL